MAHSLARDRAKDDKKMRVLFLASSDYPSAYFHRVLGLANGISPQVLPVIVALRDILPGIWGQRKSLPEEYVQALTFPIVRAFLRPSLPTNLGNYLTGNILLFLAGACVGKRHKITIVQSENSECALAGLLLAKLLGTPRVVDVHGIRLFELGMQLSNFWDNKRYKFWKRIEFGLIRTADLIVTASNPLRQFVQEYLKPDGEIIVARNCGNPFFQDSSGSLDEGEFPANKLAYFGGGHDYQGLHLLFSALKSLHDEVGPVELLLVGPTPSPQLKEMSKRLGIEKSVVWMPYRELPELFKEIRDTILVLPRDNSPATRLAFPSKFADFLRSARPIISTDVGEVGKILIETGAGMVVPPTAAEITRAVQVLRHDSSLGKELARKALELSSVFKWKSESHLLTEAYLILGKSSSHQKGDWTSARLLASEADRP